MGLEKRSNEDLRLELLKGLSHVQLGAAYRHKKSGTVYIPKLVAMDENKMEMCVAYSPLTASGVTWVRPLSEWMEKFSRVKTPE